MERGRSARESVPFKLPVYFFRGGEIISLSKKDTQKTHPKRVIKNTERNPLFKKGKFLSIFLYTDNKFIRERPLLQGVPSFKTVHWTVLKFTLCGAPKGCIDLRSIWGAAPNPARGAASGLCKRGIAPFETRFCRLRRLGTPSQTLPEAPPLDSAKGALPLLKPDVCRPAVDLGALPHAPLSTSPIFLIR